LGRLVAESPDWEISEAIFRFDECEDPMAMAVFPCYRALCLPDVLNPVSKA
jgi:hypothetical protein